MSLTRLSEAPTPPGATASAAECASRTSTRGVAPGPTKHAGVLVLDEKDASASEAATKRARALDAQSATGALTSAAGNEIGTWRPGRAVALRDDRPALQLDEVRARSKTKPRPWVRGPDPLRSPVGTDRRCAAGLGRDPRAVVRTSSQISPPARRCDLHPWPSDAVNLNRVRKHVRQHLREARGVAMQGASRIFSREPQRTPFTPPAAHVIHRRASQPGVRRTCSTESLPRRCVRRRAGRRQERCRRVRSSCRPRAPAARCPAALALQLDPESAAVSGSGDRETPRRGLVLDRFAAPPRRARSARMSPRATAPRAAARSRRGTHDHPSAHRPRRGSARAVVDRALRAVARDQHRVVREADDPPSRNTLLTGLSTMRG